MKHLILLTISTILIVSCERDEEMNDTGFLKKPEIPINDSLDFNSDQIVDFVISYKEFATYDKPSSRGSITGSISPQNQNMLLYRNNFGYLFLNINDTIRKNQNTNSDWIENSADLIKIDRDYQNWDRTWSIVSEKIDYYFLAYKLVLNNSEKIGWICLEFDTMNGKISISDGGISDNSELKIHKKTIN